MSTEMAIDWRDWAARWERQQNGGLPGREVRFRVMLDLVARHGTRVSGAGEGALRLLDLCAGPGSISARALARFPAATVVAAEIDPWTVEMGRRTVGQDYPGQITWLEADLRRDGWDADLAPGSFDAILSATAVHWFQPEDQLRLYRRLAALLADGGLFLNADHFPVGTPTLDPWRGRCLTPRKRRTSPARAARTGTPTGTRPVPSRPSPIYWRNATGASVSASPRPTRPLPSTARRCWPRASKR
jgi:SAM-dependent methyltransferase